VRTVLNLQVNLTECQGAEQHWNPGGEAATPGLAGPLFNIGRDKPQPVPHSHLCTLWALLQNSDLPTPALGHLTSCCVHNSQVPQPASAAGIDLQCPTKAGVQDEFRISNNLTELDLFPFLFP